jgi:hypothetical protein
MPWDGARPYTPTMSEDATAGLSDALAEWIIQETEAAVSEALDGLGPAELQRLASAMVAKGAERPKNDQDLGRHLLASKRLLDRAIAANFGH